MAKIDEAICILRDLGVPKAQQNERSGLTLLALADVGEEADWSGARKRIIGIHDIMVFIHNKYGKQYAENSRETIRRQTLHQLVQAGIALRNPDDALRPTNSPKTVYALSPDAQRAIRKYGLPGWSRALEHFISAKGRLVDAYDKRKASALLSVALPESKPVYLSPGKHNELQAAIVGIFRPKFCPAAKVLYLGDTAHKLAHVDREALDSLKIAITEHDKLPDVILYESAKNTMFLVEAVTAHGPLSAKRMLELEETLRCSPVKRVYITAFPDFIEFKKHISDIAWDSEVWIQTDPDHMIHFNGPQFFSVYT